MLEQLLDNELWFSIFENFKEKSSFNRAKIKAYKEILEKKDHIKSAKKILNQKYEFSIPKKLEINKLDTGKKKTIYVFPPLDDFVLKAISKILTENFAHLVSDACHSFQQNKGAKTAFRSILKDKSIDDKFAFKTDISNYFNSIDITLFLESLPASIKQNRDIMWVLDKILNNNKALYKNKLIIEPKGLMAGSAIAPFLSNLYLHDIDDYFVSQKVTYARYSDDIIFFDDKYSLQNYIVFLNKELTKKNLTINESKTNIFEPNTEWTFLGFSYSKGTIDIAKATQQKLKRKISRLSRRYNKLHVEKKLTDNQTLTMFINKLNRKMLGKNFNNSDLCWSRWYFPLINTSNTLKVIDKFVQDKLRYSVNGHYSKLNYKQTPYSILQELDYQPITKLFYLFKHDFEKFNKIVQKLNISLQT
ncbi:MAG: hypothetical protein JXL97_18735 [Bacteroidales bacterium]|nr:hypothetical protein [Bacteroidales bacterium]